MAVSEAGGCQVKFTTFFRSLNDIMASAEENSREEAEDWIKALWPLDSQIWENCQQMIVIKHTQLNV